MINIDGSYELPYKRIDVHITVLDGIS